MTRVAACCLPGGACFEAGLADAEHKVEPLVALVADALRDHISAEPQVREDIARAAVNAIAAANPHIAALAAYDEAIAYGDHLLAQGIADAP